MGGREAEEEEERRREEEEKRRKLQQEEDEKMRVDDESRKDVEGLSEEGGQEVQHRLEVTSASLAAAVQAVEHKIKDEDTQNE